MIYADNAATTPLHPRAFEAMRPYLTAFWGNASQPYRAGRQARKALEQARSAIAQAIGAEADEIFFTSGGTESDNWAIRCAGDFGRSLVQVSAVEHHAVLNACRGLETASLPADGEGLVQATAISPRARLVSVMLAQNELGVIEPVQAIARKAHLQGALFHCDAVQAMGHLRIDVRNLGVDLLSASAHKFNGPRGIGFLYVRRGTPITPLVFGGAQESGLRAGTENLASAVGMAEALRLHLETLEDDQKHLLALEEILLEALGDVPFCRNAANAPRLPGFLSLSFPQMSGETLLHRLDLQEIALSTGAACDSKEVQISHVLKAIGLNADLARGTVRITFGAQNTRDEAQAVGKAIRGVWVKGG